MGENIPSHTLVSIPTACFPSLEYLNLCSKFRSFNLEGKETYPKQTLRNRYLILGANSPLLMTVPITKLHGSKTKTEDILIDNTSNWRKIHLETLKTSYNNSPYFDHYLYDLRMFYEASKLTLLEWNTLFLTWLNSHLDLDLQFENTREFVVNTFDEAKTIQLRKDLAVYSENHYLMEQHVSILHHLFSEGPMCRTRIQNYFCVK